jgi:hypothetical protein
MAQNAKATYGLSSFIVGLVLAALFGILAGANAGGQRGTYIGALGLCVVAAIVGLILFLKNK